MLYVWFGGSSGAKASLDFVFGLKANIKDIDISGPVLDSANDSSDKISARALAQRTAIRT